MKLDIPSFEFRREKKNRLLTIPLERSDGDASRRPPEDEDWEECHADSEASIRWRGMVGSIVVQLCRNPEWADPSDAWHLSDWPDGYSMWRKERNNHLGRYDYYLYGGPTGRFCSPIEVVLHAFFLFSEDEHVRPGGCRCRCCTRRKQGDVNRTELHHISLKSVDETKAKHGSAGPGRARQSNHSGGGGGSGGSGPVDAQVRGILASLRDHNSPTNLRIPSVVRKRDQAIECFRPGELAWLSIPPIVHPDKPELNIRFWPCIIQSVESAEATGASKQPMYQVTILGVGKQYECPQKMLLPYVAYRWQSSLVTDMHYAASRALTGGNLVEVTNFHPEQGQGGSSAAPRSYQNALVPLAIAHWVSSMLQEKLTPIEPWEGRFVERDGGSALRFQGCWLGPEMLWEGDLIRLHLSWKELEQAPQMQLNLIHSDVHSRGILVKIKHFKLVHGKCFVYGSVHGHTSDKVTATDLAVSYPLKAPQGLRFVDVSHSKPTSLSLDVFAGRYYSQDFMKGATQLAKSTKEADRMQRLWLPISGKQGFVAGERVLQIDGSRLAFIDSLLGKSYNEILPEVVSPDYKS